MTRGLTVFWNMVRFYCLRHISTKPLRSGLTVIGVSLGVALFIAIDIVSESVQTSFTENVNSVTGRAALTVFGSETGFPEEAIVGIENTKGVQSVIPLIESKVFFRPQNSGNTETLVVLGIDLLKDSAVRTYKTENEEVIEDPLTFLNTVDSIIITRSFADENHLSFDSKVKLATAEGLKEFQVRGILSPEGPAKAYGGKLIVMDIDAARVAFGKAGKVDRADIVPMDEFSIESVSKSLEQTLGSGYKVLTPESQSESLKKLVSGFSEILRFLSLLALLVSIFVVSNSMNIMLAERRREIGIFRSIGAGKTGILASTLFESLLIGALGAILGIFLGEVLARLLADAISAAVASQYLIPVQPSALKLSKLSLLQGILAGTVSSCVASGLAAYRSAKISPLEAMKGFEDSTSTERSPQTTILRSIGFLLLLWIPADFYLGLDRQATALSYLSPICAILGSALAGPFLVAVGIRLVRRCTNNSTLWLAANSLLRHPKRTGSNVMSLMIGLLFVILLACINSSAKYSATSWVDKVLVADLVVSSNGRVSSYQVQPLKEQFIGEINKLSGIDVSQGIGATALRFVRQDYEGYELALKAFDPGHPRAKANVFDIVSPVDYFHTYDEFFNSTQPVIMVSENFVLKFKKFPGESIRLNTPTGAKDFKIISTVREFANPNGVIYVSRETYKLFWRDNLVTAFFVFAKPGVGTRSLAEEIDTRFGITKGVVATQNTELKRQIFEMIEDSFSYAYAIELAALIIGLLGLANTLYVSVLERTRELGMLRAVGMCGSQLVKMIFLEAALLGSLGALAAIILGSFVSYYWVIGTISSLLGWIIKFKMPWDSIFITVIVGIIVGCLAAMLPARRANKLKISEALAYE